MIRTPITTILPVAVAIGVLSTPAYAQIATIPEAIAQGATNRHSTTPSGIAPLVTDILRRTDIVVRGIVGEPRSYLSDDKMDVYTDYPIKNPLILFQTETASPPTPGAAPASSRRPGVAPAFTVTQLGGTVTISGVNFTQIEDGLSPLVPGSEGLFLLKRDGGRYHIAGTYYGAFEVANGKLKPLTNTQNFAPEFLDAPAAEGAAQIAALARAQHTMRQ